MKRLLLLPILLSMAAPPAHGVTCADGMQVIAQLSHSMELTAPEQANIDALIAKAKTEQVQGHEHSCKIVLADAIRFFLIKSALE